MNLSLARKIDYYIGVPACMVLSWIVRLYERLRPATSHQGPRRVLLIELSEMGSTILATPAIKWLEKRHPGVVPCFVILEKNVASLKLLRLFEDRNIFTIRDDSPWTMLWDFVRFTRFCRQRGIDTAIDLELYSRISSMLSMLSGARTRVGFHNYRGEGLQRGEHLTHQVNYNPYYHMSQNFIALVEALECDPSEIPAPKRLIPPPEEPLKAPVEPESYEYIERALAGFFERAPEHRLVVLNYEAGALLPIRTWPLDRFAQLTQRLLQWNENLMVILMGIPEAMDGAERIARSVDDARCINFVGQTRSIEDVVQLFHQSDLLITNDSGPAHFATLTDIKNITLFGPETPSLYGPLGKGAIHIYKQLACSPCITAANHRNSPCTNNVCLQEISVEEVFASARRLLRDGGESPSS